MGQRSRAAASGLGGPLCATRWTAHVCDDHHMVTADWYRHFAEKDARGSSPTYEHLALAVSQDDDLLTLLETLPQRQRQPNTLFAVVRLLGGPVDDPAAFRDFVRAGWPKVAAELGTRATQTNEPGRCALVLPVLAALPQPVALIEVGASAGLCLYPDKYTYRYGDRVLGDGGPVLDCEAVGIRPPSRLPEVVWRAGLDLNPLDVTNPADVAWLDALVWLEHTERRERLHRAVAIAAAEPPLLVSGDLHDALPSLMARVPTDATLVVFHSSMLYQVPPERRRAFVDFMHRLERGHWIAVEAPHVLPYRDLPPPPDDTALNVLALDGRPLAWTRGHGQGLVWFGDALRYPNVNA